MLQRRVELRQIARNFRQPQRAKFSPKPKQVNDSAESRKHNNKIINQQQRGINAGQGLEAAEMKSSDATEVKSTSSVQQTHLKVTVTTEWR